MNRRTAISALALAAAPAIAGPAGLRLPGGFDPRQIPGLKLWLDASQIAGLNDGDAVGTWSDLSGNGNDATQATASNKPTFQTNELNGLPSIQFDGVDDFLSNSPSLLSVSKFLVGVVYYHSGQHSAISEGKLSQYNDDIIAGAAQTSAGTDGMSQVGNGSDFSCTYTITNSSWLSIVLQFDGTQIGNANRLRIWVNGSEKTLNYNGGTVPATTSSNMNDANIGTYVSSPPNWYLNGKVSEVVKSTGDVSARDNLIAYFAAKYGL